MFAGAETRSPDFVGRPEGLTGLCLFALFGVARIFDERGRRIIGFLPEDLA